MMFPSAPGPLHMLFSLPTHYCLLYIKEVEGGVVCLTSLSFLCSNISERKPTQLLTMVTSWEGKGSEAMVMREF